MVTSNRALHNCANNCATTYALECPLKIISIDTGILIFSNLSRP